jgi:hypothetical protein
MPASFYEVRHVRPKLSCTGCDGIVQVPGPESADRARGGRTRTVGPRAGLKTPITCPCIVSPRSMPTKAWSWNARHWRTSWAERAGCWSPCGSAVPLSDGCQQVHADDTRCRYWLRGMVRPRLGVCGTMFAMTVPQAAPPHQRCGLLARLEARPQGRASREAYASVPRYPASRCLLRIPSTLRERPHSRRLPAGRHLRRKFYHLQQAHASPLATEALARTGALYAIEQEIRGRPRTSGSKCAMCGPNRCSNLCGIGSKKA